jgi:DNA-binding NarL/FixJ family response regulator
MRSLAALATLIARLAVKAPSLAATPEQIDAVLVLRRSGHSIPEIAARLNLPRATVGLVIRESGVRSPPPPRPSGLGPPWWGLR